MNELQPLTSAEKLRAALLHDQAAELIRSEAPAEACRHEREAARLRAEAEQEGALT